MDEPATSLPQTHVLSYVSAINTPTRVRVVACTAAVGLGAVQTLVGVIATVILVSRVMQDASWFFSGGALDIAERFFRHYCYFYPVPTILSISCIASPILLFTARGIYRGRAPASQLAGIFLLIPFFQVAILAAMYNGYALVMAFPFRGAAEPQYLVRLISLPFFLIPALLLLDLRTFLKWIARNPTTEKPPTSFLPGAKHG